MSAGGDFGNPLRKFKLVFLGEQSGECAAPPLLAAGRGFPAPPPVRPFWPPRLPAGLAPPPPQPFSGVLWLLLAPSSSSLGSIGLLAWTLTGRRPDPAARSQALSGRSVLRSPHPAQPPVHPFLPRLCVVSFTPAGFLGPHPYSLPPFPVPTGAASEVPLREAPPLRGTGPSSTLAEGGWDLGVVFP